MPCAQRLESRPPGVVVSGLDLDVSDAAMSDLLMRVEDRLLVARESRLAETDRHALGEELPVLGSGQEVPPASPHDAETLRDRLEDLRQRAATRPPELVRVRVDHPVGAELGRSEPRHTRDPLALAHVVALLVDEMEATGALVPLENLRRPVVGGVVGRDDEVDAGIQVERELRVDDVRLVARQKRHDELHRATPAVRTTASTTRSAARPSTSPTISETASARSADSSDGWASERSIPETTSSKHFAG